MSAPRRRSSVAAVARLTLGCLDQPTSGQYRLDGEEASQLSSDRRAALRSRKIGFVFQSFNLLSRTTAVDNVLMPLAYSPSPPRLATQRARATELLQRVGLGRPGRTRQRRCGSSPPRRTYISSRSL
ncbi:MAG TPA: ATP-binding cassette domain-containing protein [Planctomycetota bacterium]|nr:ATP-binding cassette domain-containing protein [Planctomycetota bacterium]